MSTRRIRARQAAIARKRARLDRRRQRREVEQKSIASVQASLKAHNKKSAHRRVSPARRPQAGSHFLFPQRLALLQKQHVVMGEVKDEDTHVRSAFARLVTWANAGGVDLIRGYSRSLVALAHIHEQWRKPVELAPRLGKSPEARLLALVRFLLEGYPTPKSLLSAILAPGDEPFGWYVKVAQGQSLRKVIDIDAFSKRAAHLYPSAPRGLNAIAAMRWAQVRALGGTDTLARVVAQKTWLRLYVNDSTREKFWHHFLGWLVANEGFPRGRVAELAQFVSLRRQVKASFSMKGRTIVSVLRLLDDKKAEDAAKAKVKLEVFQSCGLDESAFSSGSQLGFERGWKFVEILSNHALVAEGRAMKHCVGDYDDYIRDGESAIFSLRRTYLGETKRALTVEVEFEKGKRFFGEIRGKTNREPTREEAAVVRLWARKVGVSFRS